MGEKGKKLEEFVIGYVGASYGLGVANGIPILSFQRQDQIISTVKRLMRNNE